MEERLTGLIEELSIDAGLSPEDFRFMAERGCEIAFNDNLNERIARMGGFENLEDDDLRELLLVTARGGILEVLSKSANEE